MEEHRHQNQTRVLETQLASHFEKNALQYNNLSLCPSLLLAPLFTKFGLEVSPL